VANYRYSKKVKKTTNYKSKTKRQDKSEVVKAARVGWVGRERRKEEKRSHLLTFLSFPSPDIPTLQNTHFFFFSIFNLLFSKSQAFCLILFHLHLPILSLPFCQNPSFFVSFQHPRLIYIPPAKVQIFSVCKVSLSLCNTP